MQGRVTISILDVWRCVQGQQLFRQVIEALDGGGMQGVAAGIIRIVGAHRIGRRLGAENRAYLRQKHALFVERTRQELRETWRAEHGADARATVQIVI